MIKLLIIKKTNKEELLNRAKKYYENNKERKKYREQTRNKYRELPNKGKHKKENIEEIDIKICNKQRITLIIFFLTWYKNGRKSFHVW